jgi:hypothetical protein
MCYHLLSSDIKSVFHSHSIVGKGEEVNEDFFSPRGPMSKWKRHDRYAPVRVGGFMLISIAYFVSNNPNMFEYHFRVQELGCNRQNGTNFILLQFGYKSVFSLTFYCGIKGKLA